MIVLDENLHDHRLIRAVSGWYPGQVASITTLRPHSVIRDDAVPTLLLQAVQPTFVTINAADFWRRIPPHNAYCIAVVALPKERVREIPGLLRRLFRLPEFKTRAARMGKILRVTSKRIEYYNASRDIRLIDWPD